MKSSTKDEWKKIGKIENGQIYSINRNESKQRLSGKHDQSLIYKKRAGKDRWSVVGKYIDCACEAALLLLFNSDYDSGFILVL